MSNTKSKSKMSEQDVDVLYQKLGERWFAFSIINDEVFMAPIAEEKIQEIRTEGGVRAPLHKDYEAA